MRGGDVATVGDCGGKLAISRSDFAKAAPASCRVRLTAYRGRGRGGGSGARTNKPSTGRTSCGLSFEPQWLDDKHIAKVVAIQKNKFQANVQLLKFIPLLNANSNSFASV